MNSIIIFVYTVYILFRFRKNRILRNVGEKIDGN